MAQTKAQLIGGLGISTAQSLVVGSAVTINSSGISAGIITATSFVGGVSGNATGLSGTPNITVGFVTATEFDISGSSNTLNAGGLNVGVVTATTIRVGTAVTINSGVVTATSFVGNLTGTATTATNLADAANITTGTINSARLSGSYSINITGTASTASFATTSFALSGTPNLNVGITTVTGLGGVAYAGITSTAVNKTLINREYCTVVAAGVTVTLPASPSPGWEVGIAVGNFTNTVVARNGSNIMALAEDFTMDVAYLALQFVYVDSVQGWRYF